MPVLMPAWGLGCWARLDPAPPRMYGAPGTPGARRRRLSRVGSWFILAGSQRTSQGRGVVRLYTVRPGGPYDGYSCHEFRRAYA
eukprot:2651944-Prymnesium_polylepis.1